MSKPRISIITPCFNQGQYIEQTICSVLDQNYPNLEYLIIDGGSTDATVEIIKKYEKHITYWVSEPDNGQTDAINKGFQKCTGNIFNWLNSDDYYAPQTLHIVGQEFSKDDRTKALCGKEYGFYSDKLEEKVLHHGSIIRDTVEETIFTGIIDQPCTFFRKKDIEEFFPLTASLKYVMDRELWWSFLAKYGLNDIKQIDDVLTFFRLHSTSKSIQEGDKFEGEFALLKLMLLKNINAPQWLIDDMDRCACAANSADAPLKSLTLQAANEEKLLGVFAYDSAVRNYVKNDLKRARTALRFLKKLGGLKKEYLPLYFKAGILHPAIVKTVKQLKKSFF